MKEVIDAVTGPEERPPAGHEEGPPRRQNLVEAITDRLRQDIRDGGLKAGDKLPSEAGLTERYSVSRTVIREAVSALRADGLLESRHGAGVFVLAPKPAAPGLSLLGPDNPAIPEILAELELRAAVEVEAAALAAERCSPAQEAEIQACLNRFSELMKAGEATAPADFDLHLAIARATNNARFEAFLDHLGRRTIPRAKLLDAKPVLDPAQVQDDLEARHARDASLHAEHVAVADAIFDRDPERARQAMRAHLQGSIQRYRRLVRPQRD